jgi:hypothetical protein
VSSIDPGNEPDGLFWTIRLPGDNVRIDFREGEARMCGVDIPFLDFGTLDNDLRHGKAVPATASFRVRWSEAGGPFHLRDEDNGFEGVFRETQAIVEYTAATQAGFQFVSDPAETSQTVFAMIGHERNGVFFR